MSVVAGAPTGPVEVPALVRTFAEHIDDVVWSNEIGGYTFVAGDRFLKWNPPDVERIRYYRAAWDAAP